MLSKDMLATIKLFEESLPEGQTDIDILVLDAGELGILAPVGVFVSDEASEGCREFAEPIEGLSFAQHYEDLFTGHWSSAFIARQ